MAHQLGRVWFVACLVGVLALSCVAEAHADVPPESILRLQDGDVAYDLSPHVQVLTSAASLHINEVLARHADLFTPAGSDLASGTSSGARWLRFGVVNTSSHDNWILDVGYASLDEVRLYVPQASGGYQMLVGGDRVPRTQSDQHTAFLAFELPEEALRGAPLFLWVETSGHLDLPLRVVPEARFYRGVTGLYLLHGLLLGVLVVMVFYNLILFVSLRERVYLLYVLYVGFTLLYMLSVTLITDQFFPAERPDGTSRVTLMLIDAVSLTALLFCRSFLDLRATQPAYDRVVRLFAGLYVVEFALIGLGSYRVAVLMMAFLGLTGPIILFGAGLVAWRQGNRSARFYLLAWSVLLAVGFLAGLRFLGVASVTELSALQMQYAYLIAACLEAVLLALALADRIRQKDARHEREKRKMLTRIADDLHDDIGSRLSSAALQVEMAGRFSASEPGVGAELEHVAGQVRRLVDDLRDTVWLVDATHGTLPQLIDRIESVALTMLRNVRHRVICPEVVPLVPVPPEVQRSMLMILKEAVHNALRHADAALLTVEIACDEDDVRICIEDDGRGFDPAAVRQGRGSRTMQERAQQADLALHVHSAPGEGTRVEFAWRIV